MGSTPAVAPKILERDGYRCVYCGIDVEDAPLTVDHLTPPSWFERGAAEGDPDDPTNLVACCGPCNSLKRDLNFRLFADYLRAARLWTTEDVRELTRRVNNARRRRLPA